MRSIAHTSIWKDIFKCIHASNALVNICRGISYDTLIAYGQNHRPG